MAHKLQIILAAKDVTGPAFKRSHVHIGAIGALAVSGNAVRLDG